MRTAHGEAAIHSTVDGQRRPFHSEGDPMPNRPHVSYGCLVLLGLLLPFPAAGQTCTPQAPAARTMRSEGLTELIADLVLTCTGGNPASPFLANFQVFANTNITSRVVS